MKNNKPVYKFRPCKRCGGRGKVPTGIKADRYFLWPPLPDNPFAMCTCPTCHGKGSL